MRLQFVWCGNRVLMPDELAKIHAAALRSLGPDVNSIRSDPLGTGWSTGVAAFFLEKVNSRLGILCCASPLVFGSPTRRQAIGSISPGPHQNSPVQNAAVVSPVGRRTSVAHLNGCGGELAECHAPRHGVRSTKPKGRTMVRAETQQTCGSSTYCSGVNGAFASYCCGPASPTFRTSGQPTTAQLCLPGISLQSCAGWKGRERRNGSGGELTVCHGPRQG
jgi:hypothetical protein